MEIRKDGQHVALLSTIDPQLIELLTTLLEAHGGTYRVRAIPKTERRTDDTPYLAQFNPKKPE